MFYRRPALHDLLGGAEQPIVIRGAGPPTEPFVASARRQHRQHRRFQRTCRSATLTLDGAHQPARRYIAEGYGQFAHHITLENLHIVNPLASGIFGR